jgi:hypothetical protein
MELGKRGFVIYRCKVCGTSKTKRLGKVMRHLARCTQTQLNKFHQIAASPAHLSIGQKVS